MLNTLIKDNIFIYLFLALLFYVLLMVSINIGDEWKGVTGIKIKTAGVWKDYQTGYGKIKIGETWKTIP